jgi:hypothetical protein
MPANTRKPQAKERLIPWRIIFNRDDGTEVYAVLQCRDRQHANERAKAEYGDRIFKIGPVL